MSGNLVKDIENIWSDRNLLSIGLLPLSFLYRFIIEIRRFLYKIGLFTTRQVNCPVIIVGNISTGGNGKTPFTIWLVNWLKTQGFRPGIINRGYKGTATEWPILVDTSMPAAYVGDEAWLLSKRLECPVVVGPNRYDDCCKLLKENDCDIIVSDDGLQHLALHRDFEIVLVPDKKYSGNGYCLPAGPMREPVSRLNNADLVVKTSGKSQDIQISVEGFRNLSTHQLQTDVAIFQGHKILAVCGIAHPERFFKTLAEQGLKFECLTFPDHYKFKSSDLCLSDYDTIIMTEKDAVKCVAFSEENHWCMVIDMHPELIIIDELKRKLLPQIIKRNE